MPLRIAHPYRADPSDEPTLFGLFFGAGVASDPSLSAKPTHWPSGGHFPGFGDLGVLLGRRLGKAQVRFNDALEVVDV